MVAALSLALTRLLSCFPIVGRLDLLVMSGRAWGSYPMMS